ncbi:MAG TPA: glutaminase A [Lachnospiraceae bacterium]|nr:glutaminase A [Lachnospiraceae bacterium]
MITQELLEDALKYGKCFVRNGNTASYIPELQRVNKYQLGICAVGMDGEVMEAGDSRVPFTIQSISKIISLILAIRDRGADYLFHDKVGVEPTGDPFNSIIKLETKTRPFNPFINAGAIAVASCINGDSSDEKFERFLSLTRKLCNNETIELNENVYRSEKETGDRNRALAYYLKASGVLEGDVEECLDFYFKMCSVNVTALDVANLSGLLANHGCCPATKEALIESQSAKAIRALMLTCGMYDGSGEFAMTVGFPAKSGVGGGIAVSLAGRMGIGVFGPALDEKGNSVGGIKMLEFLSDRLNCQLF